MPRTPTKKGAAPARDRATIMPDLLAHMSDGGTLRAFGRDRGIPSSTLLLWSTDPEWADQYARAREAQAHAKADELEEVARQALTCETSEQVAAHRLLVDTLKWSASKLFPRQYGEKQAVEHSGGIRVAVEYTDDDE